MALSYFTFAHLRAFLEFLNRVEMSIVRGCHMRKALLITDASQAYYYTPFIEPCRALNVRVQVLDTRSFPTASSISITLDTNGAIRGSLQVLDYQDPNPKCVPLEIDDIDIAWHLRPGVPLPIAAMTELEARFTQNESIAALESLYAIMQCAWVNKRERIQFVECNKFYQQHIAHKTGFKIPRTIISNDPASVYSFCGENRSLLLKTIGSTTIDQDGNHFIYSQIFSAEELRQQAKSIGLCPVFAQQYVDKRYEYRVMVIGDAVLSCRIHSQASERTKIDWRHYDFDRVRHEQAELPTAVQKQLLEFMGRIQLSYGAVDLIETLEGEFVFLEVNPSGQWHWLTVLAGLPIPQAVAQMLAAL
jgi:hypothetical protein